jgi:hypothetical protein
LRVSPPAHNPPGGSESIPRFRYNPTPRSTESYKAAIAADPLLALSRLASLPALDAALDLQSRIMHHITNAYTAIDPHAPPPNPHRHKHQPWFDKDCRAARRRFRAALHLDPSSHVAAQARFEYRRLTAPKKKQWCAARVAKLVHDARHSPANFWRQFRKKGKPIKLQCMSQWYEYFKKLFSPVLHGHNCPSLPPLPADQMAAWETAVGHLNATISRQEVEEAARRLRKNKAAGIDGMHAEFILDALLPPPPSPYERAPGVESPPGPLLKRLSLVFDKIFQTGVNKSSSLFSKMGTK